MSNFEFIWKTLESKVGTPEIIEELALRGLPSRAAEGLAILVSSKGVIGEGVHMGSIKRYLDFLWAADRLIEQEQYEKAEAMESYANSIVDRVNRLAQYYVQLETSGMN
jgi:hypothetical protein